MKKSRTSYSFSQKGSAVFMILTLLWLTVSTPFIIAAQQDLAEMEKKAAAPATETDEETGNPLGNTTEEKTPGTPNSFSEEYLHEHTDTHFFVTLISLYHKCENAGTYHAYHGELLVPPPNGAAI
jgi:hypothetical protein